MSDRLEVALEELEILELEKTNLRTRAEEAERKLKEIDDLFVTSGSHGWHVSGGALGQIWNILNEEESRG
jgi:hypothetical protein